MPNMMLFEEDGLFTPEVGVTYKVICVGGGGSGGGSSRGSGAGGGSGEVKVAIFTAIDNEDIYITIGLGGVCETSGVGKSGGTTSFGDILSATGGTGGTGSGDNNYAIGGRGHNGGGSVGFFSYYNHSGTGAYHRIVVSGKDGSGVNGGPGGASAGLPGTGGGGYGGGGGGGGYGFGLGGFSGLGGPYNKSSSVALGGTGASGAIFIMW